jgi:hypothetical protein
LPSLTLFVPQIGDEQYKERGIDTGQAAIDLHAWEQQPHREGNGERRGDEADQEPDGPLSLACHAKRGEGQDVPE